MIEFFIRIKWFLYAALQMLHVGFYLAFGKIKDSTLALLYCIAYRRQSCAVAGE
jgi:hypothetical protein